MWVTEDQFPNLEMIQKSIRKLAPLIHNKSLTNVPGLWNGSGDFHMVDVYLAAQRMARKILDVYKSKPGTTVIVDFQEKKKNVAGCVEIGPGREFFVSVTERLKERPAHLVPVLAHEIAHIFLHDNNIYFPGKLSNEILTDCAAVFYGFGPVMANTDETYSSGTKNITTKMGYLTTCELGYVQAKVGFMVLTQKAVIRHADPLKAYYREAENRITNRKARESFKIGRSKADSEFDTVPLAMASWRPLSYRDNPGMPIVFNCPLCSGKIRIASRGREGVVTCGHCQIRLACVT